MRDNKNKQVNSGEDQGVDQWDTVLRVQLLYDPESNQHQKLERTCGRRSLLQLTALRQCQSVNIESEELTVSRGVR